MKVALPDPVHSHYDPESHRFVTHEHPHGGPHWHELRHDRPVVVYGPGNYSPKASR